MQVWCGLADTKLAEFNLIPQSPGHDQAIAGVAAVKNLLAPVTAA
jgi:hypothetical protein